MILVSHIKQVITHDIYIHENSSFSVGYTTTYSCIKQRIAGCCSLGTISRKNPVLGCIIFNLYFGKSMFNACRFPINIQSQFRSSMRRRNEWQVFFRVRYTIKISKSKIKINQTILKEPGEDARFKINTAV